MAASTTRSDTIFPPPAERQVQQPGSEDSTADGGNPGNMPLVGPAKAEFWFSLAVFAELPEFADLGALERLPRRLPRVVLEMAVVYFGAHDDTTGPNEGPRLGLSEPLAQRRFPARMLQRWQLRSSVGTDSRGATSTRTVSRKEMGETS
jgi:hypothetical protein